jgi:hypothetical protein
MEWLASWFVPTTSNNLLSNGEIPREKILEFFSKGRSEVFGSQDFKAFLRQGHEKGRPCQDLVDQAQVCEGCSPGLAGLLWGRLCMKHTSAHGMST